MDFVKSKSFLSKIPEIDRYQVRLLHHFVGSIHMFQTVFRWIHNDVIQWVTLKKSKKWGGRFSH